MFCPNCGRELYPGENVCRACSAEYASPYQRDTVMLLCIIGFLGLSGLHRFYVGRWKGGVLFLLALRKIREEDAKGLDDPSEEDR